MILVLVNRYGSFLSIDTNNVPVGPPLPLSLTAYPTLPPLAFYQGFGLGGFTLAISNSRRSCPAVSKKKKKSEASLAKNIPLLKIEWYERTLK